MLPAMTEHEPPSASPEDILRIKDEITQRWRHLPSEHQATMALVMLQQTLEGDFGSWLRSALRALEKQYTDSPFRFLPVVRIAKSHLRHASLTEDEIAQLDEEDLMQISHQIVRHYTTDVFWEELEFLARLTLAEKRPR